MWNWGLGSEAWGLGSGARTVWVTGWGVESGVWGLTETKRTPQTRWGSRRGTKISGCRCPLPSAKSTTSRLYVLHRATLDKSGTQRCVINSEFRGGGRWGSRRGTRRSGSRRPRSIQDIIMQSFVPGCFKVLRDPDPTAEGYSAVVVQSLQRFSRRLHRLNKLALPPCRWGSRRGTRRSGSRRPPASAPPTGARR